MKIQEPAARSIHRFSSLSWCIILLLAIGLFWGCASSKKSGKNDLGEFILAYVLEHGGRPIQTNDLPTITSQWEANLDAHGVQIATDVSNYEAIVRFLRQAFGEPYMEEQETIDNGLMGVYALRDIGLAIQFGKETAEPAGAFVIMISGELTEEEVKANFTKALSRLGAEAAAADYTASTARKAEPKPPPRKPMKLVFDQHAGLHTPEAAIASAIWELREGRRKTGSAIAGDDEVYANWQRQVEGATGIQILEWHQLSATEMGMKVYLEGAEQEKQALLREGSRGWKIHVFGNHPNPMSFYQESPELMKRYFPHLLKDPGLLERNFPDLSEEKAANPEPE